MTFKVRLSGFSTLKHRMMVLPMKATTSVSRFSRLVGEHLVQQMKFDAPEDTGDLVQSINLEQLSPQQYRIVVGEGLTSGNKLDNYARPVDAGRRGKGYSTNGKGFFSNNIQQQQLQVAVELASQQFSGDEIA